MTIHCCGKERTSPFCPQCGRKLQEDPLVELLNHMRVVLDRKKTELAYSLDHPKHDRNYAPPENLKATVAKWERWIEAVRPLVKDEG